MGDFHWPRGGVYRNNNPPLDQSKHEVWDPRPVLYGNSTRNQDHPQNKHNEDNRNAIGLSPGEVQGAKWRQLKRRNQAKAKREISRLGGWHFAICRHLGVAIAKTPTLGGVVGNCPFSGVINAAGRPNPGVVLYESLDPG